MVTRVLMLRWHHWPSTSLHWMLWLNQLAAQVVTQEGVWLCRAKRKGVDLGAKGDIQKPKPKAKPAHAKVLGLKARQQLIKDNKCFVCCEVGHNQNDAKRCTRHPDHAKAIGKGVAAMQVDQQKN